MAVIVIRYETTATARWTSPFIVRAFFNDTITVAVWTGFHARLMHMLPHPSNGRAAMGRHDANGSIIRWCFSALPEICGANRNVRFGPRADIATQLPIGLVSVNFDNCLPRRSSRALIVGGQYRAELSGIFAA